MSDWTGSSRRDYLIWKRITSLLVLAVVLFWGVWSFFGSVPSINLSSAGYIGKHLPWHTLSRWWDVLAIPAWVSMFAVFFLVVESVDQRSDEEIGWRSFIVGILFAIVAGVTFILSLGYIGLLPGLFVCFGLSTVLAAIFFSVVVVMDFVSNISVFLDWVRVNEKK